MREYFLGILKDQEKKKTLLFLAGIFIVLSILGIAVYKDYGISWDEPLSHQNGFISLNYVEKSDPTLWTYSERFYGVVFEMPFAYMQELFDFKTSQELFFARHLLTYLVFVVAILFFFLICLKRFKNHWFALLGPLFLILSPRIFADSFYNSKDIPLLIFFVLSIYTLLRLLEKPNFKNAILHALVSALAIDTRLPGIFIPVLTGSFFALDHLILPEPRKEWRKILKIFSTYFVSLLALVVLFWPFLWQHPISHLIEALADMSKFSRQVGMQVLYFGQMLKASEIPWHYIPVWISITTPFLYILLFFLGIFAVTVRVSYFFKEKYLEQRQDLVVLAWFFGPLLAVIILNSVLYDGWRHLYFIYPAFVYIALLGLDVIINLFKKYNPEIQTILKGFLTFVIAVNLLLLASFMIRNHPYQNLYFNFLAGSITETRKDFDLDYWGLTFREGLEYIAAHDTDPYIPISIVGGSPDTVYILAPEIMNRFEILPYAEIAKSKYVLSNYRWQNYELLPHDREFFSVKVDNEKVMSVFKIY